MNKSILITGAASGIGLATAKLFHQRGWRVGLIDMNESALQALIDELGDERTWQQALDVRDPQATAQALEGFAVGGQLNVLFNCAGILTIGSFEEIELERHHAIVDINIKSLINFCYLALPHLKRARNAVVINMSSASAVYGVPYFASYSASKFAVRGLTEALNLEWQQHGIRVCDVMPPFVDTPMVREQGNSAPSLKRLGVKLSAEDIAKTVWHSAQHPSFARAHYPITLFLKTSRLLTKLSPDVISRQVMKWIST